MLGERSSLAQLAAANTAFVMVYELGSVSGPIVVGAAMHAAGPDALAAVAAAACLALLLADTRWRAGRAR